MLAPFCKGGLKPKWIPFFKGFFGPFPKGHLLGPFFKGHLFGPFFKGLFLGPFFKGQGVHSLFCLLVKKVFFHSMFKGIKNPPTSLQPPPMPCSAGGDEKDFNPFFKGCLKDVSTVIHDGLAPPFFADATLASGACPVLCCEAGLQPAKPGLPPHMPHHFGCPVFVAPAAHSHFYPCIQEFDHGS